MSLADGDVFAGYTVVRMLAPGGMGEVYLVRHPSLLRLDALKVLPMAISAIPEFRSRFERDADLLATLRHPHIVGIHDRGEDDGRLWIAMDFAEGNDAALLLRKQWPDGMPADVVLAIVSAMADALDYAHDRQLLHRNIKPSKILLTDDDGPKRLVQLVGFGIAGHTSDGAGLDGANMTVGDVNYAAPEQLLDEEVDGRADQYALAATTYHLLTGSAPFPHANPTVVISRHLNTQPPALANTHPQLAALDPVLGRALAKTREARYPTAREFAHALTAALQDTNVSGSARSSPPRTSGAGFFAPEPAPTSPADIPVARTAASAEAPPVYVSDWGATQQNTQKEHRAVEPRAAAPSHPSLPTPSRGGPSPVLIGVAIGTAILLIALITFAVLKAAAGDSSKSAPQVTPFPPMSMSSATLASSTNPSRPTTRAAPTTTVQQMDCGIDLGSPVVTSAVVEVEPGAAYPLDRANTWGNFDPCAPLSVALVPTAMGTGSSPVEPLMFQMGHFIGKATPSGIGYLRFNEQLTTDDTVVLTFRTSIGTCGGCSDGTYADVRFQARNGRAVALDPIPN